MKQHADPMDQHHSFLQFFAAVQIEIFMTEMHMAWESQVQGVPVTIDANMDVSKWILFVAFSSCVKKFHHHSDLMAT